MWEFTEHRYSNDPRWTWAQVSKHGRVVQKSDRAFSSYGNALANAARHGFDAGRDEFRLVELI